MSEKRKLRIAQVGVGHFGAYRRNTLRETGLFDLVACYDINPEAMAQAEKEDGARPVGSYNELLDVDGIEAMVISTGGKFHAEQAIAAMEKGLHVFVEKPLCSTPQEVTALLETQKRTGVVVQVGHNDHSLDPVSQFIRQAIDGGELGTVSHIEKGTGHRGGFCIKPGDWRGDPEKNPGGMLFQCGVHGFHELMYYFGPIVRVSAMMRYDVNPDTGTADVSLCQLEFASGLIGTLNAFHVSPYRHYFYIYGTTRNLYREDLFFDEGSRMWMQTFTTDGAKEPWEPVTVPGCGAGGGKSHSGNVTGWYEAIVSGGPACYPTLLDGARAVAVVFAAEESAKSGRAVDIVLPE
jgi:predicted dehydrogenase